MTHPARNDVAEPLGFVWINCESQSVLTMGLGRALKERARVYTGREAPIETPSVIILCTDDMDGVPIQLGHVRKLFPEVPVLVFGLRLDLRLARAALRSGARGFIHAGMPASQVARAVTVVTKGELVAPRSLLQYLITPEDDVDLSILSARQREILELVVEGMSNAQIAQRLFLSESTVKQHLRAAYKLLRVNNRTEAARLIRTDR